MAKDRSPENANSEEGEEDTLASATHALTEAIGKLTRAVKQDVQQTGRKALSSTLRKTSQELAAAASAVVSAADNIGNGKPRERGKVERTRQDILNAAQRVIAAKGYEGASVADIAAAAGYTKGALYANFPSKEALFLEMVREWDRGQSDLLETYLAEGTLPPLLEGECSPQSDEELESLLLSLEWWIYAVRHAEARQELETMWRRTLDLTSEIVARKHGRQTPSSDDVSSAFGLAAVHMLSNIAAAIFDPDEIRAITKGLVGRLTEPR